MAITNREKVEASYFFDHNIPLHTWLSVLTITPISILDHEAHGMTGFGPQHTLVTTRSTSKIA
jgi:hypothetical protein